MHLNDAILAKTGGPTVNDGLLAYYRANGAISLDLNDAERQFLLAGGANFTLGTEINADPTMTGTAAWVEGTGWVMTAGDIATISPQPAKSQIVNTSVTAPTAGKHHIEVQVNSHKSGGLVFGIGTYKGGGIPPVAGIHRIFVDLPSGLNGGAFLEAEIGSDIVISSFSFKRVLSGNTNAHINDLWEYYLRVVKGYTGTLDDMKLAFWSAP